MISLNDDENRWWIVGVMSVSVVKIHCLVVVVMVGDCLVLMAGIAEGGWLVVVEDSIGLTE